LTEVWTFTGAARALSTGPSCDDTPTTYSAPMVGCSLPKRSPDDILARLGLAATGAFLFATGFRIFPATAVSRLAVLASFALYGVAFASWGLAIVSKAPLKPAIEAVLGAGALLGIIVGVSYGILFEIPNYGTDVIALAHAGGEVLLDGVNPYSVERDDVQSILDRMNLRSGLFTTTIDGDPVPGVTYYPALHVLVFIPFVAIGLPDLRWVVLAFELTALIVIWSVVSQRARYLIPAVLLLEPYLTVIFTSGGVTDWLWVLPLCIAALFLHRDDFAWAGFWLGLACAVKQQPWFVVPFATIWVIHRIVEKRNSALYPSLARPLGSFVGMMGLAFLLPNLPFILWAPMDWVNGVLGPLLLDLVPDGQGLVLLITTGLLDLNRTLFGLLVFGLTVAVAIAYHAKFNRFRNLLWLLPPMILFFSFRSLHSYFIFWLPLAALWIDIEGSDSLTPALRHPTP
jgi:hypothetical protein